jgi:HEXXH motif-containing protein
VTVTWELAAPPVEAVAFHGRGPRALAEWDAAVELDAVLWLTQLPARLNRCDDTVRGQFADAVDAFLAGPQWLRTAFVTDPLARAWLAALRSSVDIEPSSPRTLDELLSQAPVVLMPVLAVAAPGTSWKASIAQGMRSGPFGGDAILTGPVSGSLRVNEDGTIAMALPYGAIGFSTVGGQIRVDRSSLSGAPSGKDGPSFRLRTRVTSRGVWGVELLDGASFPELPAGDATTYPATEGVAQDIQRRLTDCLDLLIDMWPESIPDVASRFRALLPILTPDKRWRSATTSDLPLTIQLTLADREDPLELAEALVHESAHTKLDELQVMTPLLLNGPERIFHHPWRPDPRPLIGVLLGAHAFANVLRLYESALARGTADVASLLRRVEQGHAEVASALDTLEESGDFTTVGESLYRQLRYGVLGE